VKIIATIFGSAVFKYCSWNWQNQSLFSFCISCWNYYRNKTVVICLNVNVTQRTVSQKKCLKVVIVGYPFLCTDDVTNGQLTFWEHVQFFFISSKVRVLCTRIIVRILLEKNHYVSSWSVSKVTGYWLKRSGIRSRHTRGFVIITMSERLWAKAGRGQLKCDGTRAETRFRLSAKRTSPFKSAGAQVKSTAGSWGVLISS